MAKKPKKPPTDKEAEKVHDHTMKAAKGPLFGKKMRETQPKPAAAKGKKPKKK